MEKNAEEEREVVKLKGIVWPVPRGPRDETAHYYAILSTDGEYFWYVASDYKYKVEVSKIQRVKLYMNGNFLDLVISPMKPPERYFIFKRTEKAKVMNFLEKLQSTIRFHEGYFLEKIKLGKVA